MHALIIEILMGNPALLPQIGLPPAAHSASLLSGSKHVLHPSFLVFWFNIPRWSLRSAFRLSRLVVPRGDSGRLLELVLLLLAQMLVSLLGR